MPTTTELYTNKIVRKGNFRLIEQETGRILLMARSTEMTLDNGLGAKQEITETDNEGFETVVGLSFGERKSRMTLNFSGRNLDTTSLVINKKTGVVTVEKKFPFSMIVARSDYAAAPTGKLGAGVVEDATCNASYQDPITRETANLTQQNFATFNPATPRSFAIGTDFARKFSDDVVTDNLWVNLAPSASYTARGISEEEFGLIEVTGICFNSARFVSLFSAPTTFIDPEGGGISADGTSTLNLVIPSLLNCLPWNEYEIDAENFCEN